MVQNAVALIDQKQNQNQQQDSIISAGLSDVIGKGFERHNNWIQTSALVVADTVGTGVLGIGAGFAVFGWLVGTLFFVLFAPINYFTAFLLNRVHLQHPEAKTLGDAAKCIWGSGLVGYIGLPVYLWFVMGSYLQVLTHVVQQLFHQMNLCFLNGSIIACVVLLPFIQLRTLHNLALLSAVSFITVFCTICICLVMILTNEVECSEDHIKDMGLHHHFSAAGRFIFAFAGQSIFLEMNAEMKEPKHFPRSLNLAYAIMLTLYYLVSSSTFGHCGKFTPDSQLTDLVARGPWLTVIGSLMLIHMIISYNISSTVLTRTIFVNSGLTVGVEQSVKGRFAWFLMSTGLMLSCALCANFIPNFGNMIGLISDVLICPLCFILPAALYLSMDGKRPADHAEKAGILTKGSCWFVMLLFSVQMCFGGYYDVLAIGNSKPDFPCGRIWES